MATYCEREIPVDFQRYAEAAFAAAATYFRLPLLSVAGAGKTKPVVEARRVAWRVIRRTGTSFSAISMLTGHDHVTVMQCHTAKHEHVEAVAAMIRMPVPPAFDVAKAKKVGKARTSARVFRSAVVEPRAFYAISCPCGGKLATRDDGEPGYYCITCTGDAKVGVA